MKIKIILLTALTIILGCACDDDDHLTPTEGLEQTYILPQGNHDYDNKIVDWNKRCGFYILYKFEPKDVYWGQTTWLEAIKNEEGVWTKNGILWTPADENYVGKQVEFLENNLLNLYPEPVIRLLMPYKFLLCSELQEVIGAGIRPYTEDLSLFPSVDMIILSHGDKSITELDAEEILSLKNTLNTEVFWRVINAGKIPEDTTFVSISKYGDLVSDDEMYSQGFIYAPKNNTNKKDDFKHYVEAILTTSYQDLTAETETEDYTYKGILHRSKDTKGLINKKYNAVISYFKRNYNFDIQKIGNGEKSY